FRADLAEGYDCRHAVVEVLVLERLEEDGERVAGLPIAGPQRPGRHEPDGAVRVLQQWPEGGHDFLSVSLLAAQQAGGGGADTGVWVLKRFEKGRGGRRAERRQGALGLVAWAGIEVARVLQGFDQGGDGLMRLRPQLPQRRDGEDFRWRLRVLADGLD